MALQAKDVTDALAEREQSQRILDRWGAVRVSYRDWKEEIRAMDDAYNSNYLMRWPDNSASVGYPKVPNLPLIAAEDRARLVAAGNPSIVCRSERTSDRAKSASEKRERILAGYWERNRVRLWMPAWAHDLMASGVSLVKVLPDFASPKRERFPVYDRVDPRYAYPGPAYSKGPFLEDCIVTYRGKQKDIGRRFGMSEELATFTARAKARSGEKGEEITVIEFYDEDILAVLAVTGQGRSQSQRWLIEPTKHNLKHCPIAIGVRPTPAGIYRGDFIGSLAVMNVWNQLMTLHLDAAMQAVYPARITYDIENPEEYGPDAELRAQSREGKVEFVQTPGQNFSNHQMLALLGKFAEVSALMPPSRSGDPNESIISAAGMSQANSQMADHVRSLERDSLAPMLEAANELAFRSDETAADVKKDIVGYIRGTAFRDTYKPSEDIGGNYRNQVVYGLGSAGGEINTSVMALQQAGAGLISKQTAREQSVFVEDPIAEGKRIAKEFLQDAMFAGLVSRAQANAVDPVQLARIDKALESENKTLSEAIQENLAVAPLAQPPASAAPAGAPGVAGAARGQQAQGAQAQRPSLPPLEQLLGGARP